MSIGSTYQTYTVLFRARATATDARITFGLGIALPAGKDFYLDTLSLQACKPNDGVALMDNDVGNIIYNNDAGAYKRFVLTDQGSNPDYYNTGLHNQGDFYYNPGNWTVRCIPRAIRPAITPTSKWPAAIMSSWAQSYTTFEDLDVRYGSSCGIVFKSNTISFTDTTVTGCDISYIGGNLQSGVGAADPLGRRHRVVRQRHEFPGQRLQDLADLRQRVRKPSGRRHDADQHRLSQQPCLGLRGRHRPVGAEFERQHQLHLYREQCFRLLGLRLEPRGPAGPPGDEHRLAGQLWHFHEHVHLQQHLLRIHRGLPAGGAAISPTRPALRSTTTCTTRTIHADHLLVGGHGGNVVWRRAVRPVPERPPGQGRPFARLGADVADPANDDFHLLANSPAINAGCNTANDPYNAGAAADFAGLARQQGEA